MHALVRSRAAAAILLAAALLAAAFALRPRDAGHNLRWPSRIGHLENAVLAFAWPEFHARREIVDPAELRALDRSLGRGTRTPGRVSPHFPYWRLTIRYAGGRLVEVVAARDLTAYLPAEGAFLEDATLRAFLDRETRVLARGFFGEPLPWPVVDRLWPWDTTAVVRDLETGARFVADRYGGYRHADAQPATARDTALMKAIYRGRWSWLRRAVVVEVRGRHVAGSMNGMPHGEGTIFDNDFQGHFCIHFPGSTTHGSRREDPGHRLMILKAAGRLAETLDRATPGDVASLALAAVYQQDTAALRHATDRVDPLLQRRLFDRIEHVEIGLPREISTVGNRSVVAVEVMVYAKPDPDRGERKRLRLSLAREAYASASPSTAIMAWKVRFDDLRQLLAGPEGADEKASPQPPVPAGNRQAAC